VAAAQWADMFEARTTPRLIGKHGMKLITSTRLVKV
jgi:hypothetical protein